MSARPAPREGFVPVKNAELFVREIGQGQPVIVLHGGPDFDHTYLLPDMDRLADAYRLIYYDQRGRGRSSGDVPGLSLSTEVDDLDRLRQHLRLDSVAILGHSWGGLLAMIYALRHREHVSHLILLNSAPASHDGILLTRQGRLARLATQAAKLKAIADSPEFLAGDPAAVCDYYGLLFTGGFKHPELHPRLDMSLAHFTREGVQRARAIELQLYTETYSLLEFSLLPQLKQLTTPTLVVHGDYDFVPVAVAAEIAHAIPGSRLVVLKDCGHFAYIESPEGVRQAVGNFFAGG